MTPSDEDVGKLHCSDMERADTTLCGILFASAFRMTDKEDDVDCSSCLRILAGEI